VRYRRNGRVSAVNQRIYDALTVLQHRGQECGRHHDERSGELYMRKDSGLVRDVFHKNTWSSCAATSASDMCATYRRRRQRHDAQPFYVNSPYGICLGHNGNLTTPES